MSTNINFERDLRRVYDYMSKILIEKNKSYGSASFDGSPEFAITGNYHRQFDKMCRYKHLIEKMLNGEKPEAINEGLKDTLMDIWGYATIGLMIWNQKENFLPEDKNPGDLLSEWAYREYEENQKTLFDDCDECHIEVAEERP